MVIQSIESRGNPNEARDKKLEICKIGNVDR